MLDWPDRKPEEERRVHPDLALAILVGAIVLMIVSLGLLSWLTMSTLLGTGMIFSIAVSLACIVIIAWLVLIVAGFIMLTAWLDANVNISDEEHRDFERKLHDTKRK